MFDRLEYQRAKRKENKNLHTKKYEKTKRGFLMRLYRNMRSRVAGIQKNKAHLYNGLSLIDKDTFYCWANSQPNFHLLFSEWEESGYARKLAPSVDRKDSSLGYTQNNIEFVTQTENSRRGAYSKHEKNSGNW